MGCNEVKDPTKNLPKITCFVESRNEQQKNYCINVKERLKPKNTVMYEIKSYPGSTFQIYLTINGKQHPIQTVYDESELQNTLDKLNNLLDTMENNTNPPNTEQNANPNPEQNANPNPEQNPPTDPNANPAFDPNNNQNNNELPHPN